MKNKPAHFMSNPKPAETGLLEFDLLTIQAFLKIEKVQFEFHCRYLGIKESDVDRIIKGLI